MSAVNRNMFEYFLKKIRIILGEVSIMVYDTLFFREPQVC